MKMTWSPGRCRMPRTGKRVVCGTSETIDSFDPTRRFIRVDLPTLARPTRATKPQRDASAITPASDGAAIAGPSSSSPTGHVLRVRRLAPGQAAPVQKDARGARQEFLLQASHLAVVLLMIVTEQVEKTMRHEQRHLFLEAPPGPAGLPPGLRDRDGEIPQVEPPGLQVAARRKGEDVGRAVLPPEDTVEPPHFAVGGQAEGDPGARPPRRAQQSTEEAGAARRQAAPGRTGDDHLYRPHRLNVGGGSSCVRLPRNGRSGTFS